MDYYLKCLHYLKKTARYIRIEKNTYWILKAVRRKIVYNRMNMEHRKSILRLWLPWIDRANRNSSKVYSFQIPWFILKTHTECLEILVFFVFRTFPVCIMEFPFHFMSVISTLHKRNWNIEIPRISIKLPFRILKGTIVRGSR